MIDIKKIIADDSEKKRQKKLQTEAQTVRTVGDYLEMLEKDPRIAQSAYGRADEIICGPNDENVIDVPEEEQWMGGAKKRHPFFANKLFGVDKPIEMFVTYIKAGRYRASTARQPVLLAGPPSSGKSTVVHMLMQGFEDYSLRPVFMITDCPKFEDPIHALPRYLREKVGKELGIHIGGDLCPVCREKLKQVTEPDGTVRWWDLPVGSMTFSIQAVRGLSSFAPTEEKSADVTALTGRERLDITAKYGFNHPLAFEISGKIPRGERGVVEVEELASNDESVLRIFFGIGEERRLEIQGSSFPNLSVDTVVAGHANIKPLKEFAGKALWEGLHNRFYVIPFPYPIRIKDELAAYKKIIEDESDTTEDIAGLRQCHIAPGALELAATFAVMTRYVPSSKKISALVKAKLYNGDGMIISKDANTRSLDVGELYAEGQHDDDLSKREGMFGVSSRDTLAALNMEIVRQRVRNPGKACLTPLLVIRALCEVFKGGHRIGHSPEMIAKYISLLTATDQDSVMTEHKEQTIVKVCGAFLEAYGDMARQYFDQYIEEDKYYRETKRKFSVGGAAKVRKDKLGKPREPDLKFMKSIEKHIEAITNDQEAEVFRGETLEQENLTYESCPTLARAAEMKLLEESKDMLKAVLSQDRPRNSEEQKRAHDLFHTMTHERGFCEICASESIEQAGIYLSE